MVFVMIEKWWSAGFLLVYTTPETCEEYFGRKEMMIQSGVHSQSCPDSTVVETAKGSNTTRHKNAIKFPREPGL
jgi:hypothetical protein